MFKLDIKKGQISLSKGAQIEFVSETCADNELFFLASDSKGKVYVCRVFALEVLEPLDGEAVFADVSELEK